jgi:hypothetical protein
VGNSYGWFHKQTSLTEYEVQLLKGESPISAFPLLARILHELLSRDHEDGCATRQPYRGIGSEAYLNGTSQEPTAEDTRKDGHIRGRSKRFMKYPGWVGKA